MLYSKSTDLNADQIQKSTFTAMARVVCDQTSGHHSLAMSRHIKSHDLFAILEG
jgi:hypothetical protein